MPTQRGRKTILASFGRTSDKTWKDEKNDESRIKHSSAIGELKPERSAVAVAKAKYLNVVERFSPSFAIIGGLLPYVLRLYLVFAGLSPVFQRQKDVFRGRKTSFVCLSPTVASFD